LSPSATRPGCRFPGCDNHRFVDAHHIEHWAHGGGTSLENLVLLCRHHHRTVHECGYSIDDEGRFYNRWGERIENVPGLPRSDPGALIDFNDELDIDDLNYEPGGRDPLDLAPILDALKSFHSFPEKARAGPLV
jgi:hypothetical protein